MNRTQSASADDQPQKVENHNLEWLNGLRGIAALQVVLLHFFAYFYPAFAGTGTNGRYAEAGVSFYQSPFFFLLDGYTAVHLFFIMSGFVLAKAFENDQRSFSGKIAKRSIRLALPAAMATFLSYSLFAAAPTLSQLTYQITQSNWQNDIFHLKLDPVRMAKEILISNVFFGYQGISILKTTPIADLLQPLTTSGNAPTWTLHIEFWGSMLLLALSSAKNSLPKKYYTIIIFTLILTAGTSFYILFLAGFLSYQFRNQLSEKKYFGVTLIAVGILFSYLIPKESLEILFKISSKTPFLHSENPTELIRTLSASLIFWGILQSGQAKRALELKIFRWLGKISFSLYLVHFSLLFTLGAFVMLSSSPFIGYLPSSIVTFFIFATVSILFASAFERWIDRPAILLSRRFTTRQFNK